MLERVGEGVITLICNLPKIVYSHLSSECIKVAKEVANTRWQIKSYKGVFSVHFSVGSTAIELTYY